VQVPHSAGHPIYVKLQQDSKLKEVTYLWGHQELNGETKQGRHTKDSMEKVDKDA
jgi:hypothetical protein